VLAADGGARALQILPFSVWEQTKSPAASRSRRARGRAYSSPQSCPSYASTA
jgi:hypothetical protein